MIPSSQEVLAESTTRVGWQDRILEKSKKFRWPLVIAAVVLAFIAPRFSSLDRSLWIEESAGLLGWSVGGMLIPSGIMGWMVFRNRKGGWSVCYCCLFFVACAYRCMELFLTK
jgi:hypothetical protein